jgi:hypothetical protein
LNVLIFILYQFPNVAVGEPLPAVEEIMEIVSVSADVTTIKNSEVCFICKV